MYAVTSPTVVFGKRVCDRGRQMHYRTMSLGGVSVTERGGPVYLIINIYHHQYLANAWSGRQN